ncbi:MAG: alpha/beta fold hydrolase [Gordonia sp. (in: high G+C Gram-positive bacteria)]|uniref:esterase/lipase family protein n=1 Tax=Gordonia sp. (in: high G+C Gram-positive bacteria) TaxID=84139 RepID=UPI0039E5A630
MSVKQPWRNRRFLTAAVSIAAAGATVLGVAPANADTDASIDAPAAPNEAAQIQQLTDKINAGSQPGHKAEAVLPGRKDVDWTGYTRKLPPIPNTVGQGPRQGGFWSAFAYGQVYPNAAPPGANDWNCKPKAGQNPVVLLHGTWENAYDNWAAFAPALKKAGYCVYTPNYGRTDLLDIGGLGTILPGTNGVAKVSRSAQQIKPYIDKVLKKTGAQKVDIIGHSQGGLLARYWMKRYNGYTKVDHLITYGATNNGTTLDGIAALGRSINNIGIDILAFPVTPLVGSGGIDQTIESPTIKYVNNMAPYHDRKQRRVYPNVKYTIVGTRYDEITTPYDITFLPEGFVRGPRYKNVKNITLQNGCEQDVSDHMSMAYSPRAISIALHALDPKRYPKLVCSSNPWFFSF